MTMRVLVVDDEPLAQQRLNRLIENIAGFTVVAQASSGKDLEVLLSQNRIDICILDIHLPGLNGLALAANLNAMAKPVAIIFCTAYEEHALAAFDYQAVDYILKPARPERLEAALIRAAKLCADAASDESLLIEQGDSIQRIAWTNIRGFVAEDKYVYVLSSTAKYLSNSSLVQLEQQYPERLLRIHRNALIVSKHLSRLVRTEQGFKVELEGVEQNLAVSRRHVANLRRQLKDNQPRLP